MQRNGNVAKAREIIYKLHTQKGSDLERKDVIKACRDAGVNESTASYEWQMWRRGTYPKGAYPEHA